MTVTVIQIVTAIPITMHVIAMRTVIVMRTIGTIIVFVELILFVTVILMGTDCDTDGDYRHDSVCGFDPLCYAMLMGTKFDLCILI